MKVVLYIVVLDNSIIFVMTGYFCLHEAAAGNHYLVVELLCNHAKDNVECLTSAGFSPFIIAILKGHLQTVISLVERCSANKFFIAQAGGATGNDGSSI